jgi:hypothetical protein
VDTVPGLKELQARKRDLLMESDLNRQILRVEIEKIRLRAEQIRRGYGWAHNVWKWGAPVAGFLLARKFRKTAGAFAKGSLLINAAQAIWRFWGNSNAGSRNPGNRT